jgi:hypothetical protein
VSTVTPRNAGVLPVLLFDTRRGGAAFAAIPAVAQPDTPGTAPDAQPTQVRTFGVEAPGSFGASSTAAAGAVQLHFDAGSSPVFLLLDGGSATGALAAGRLGVHGRGGFATLTGAVAGLTDGTAARTPGSEITRPISTTEQNHYTFNDCVIGATVCAPVDVLIQLVPVLPNVVAEVGSEAANASTNITRLFSPEPQIVRLRRQRDRLADPDVLLPNTIEDDY